jgi:hypothetical protein
MRSLPLRLAVTVLVLVGLTACGKINDTKDSVQSGVGKAKDCATLAGKIANINFNPDAAASELEQDAKELKDTVDNLDSEDVKRAGQNVAAKVDALVRAAKTADPAKVRKAVDDVTASVKQVATACNIDIDLDKITS